MRTKWYGQNGMRTKWYGQNGTDIMVRTKWYEDKIVQNSHLTAQLALIRQDFHYIPFVLRHTSKD